MFGLKFLSVVAFGLSIVSGVVATPVPAAAGAEIAAVAPHEIAARDIMARGDTPSEALGHIKKWEKTCEDNLALLKVDVDVDVDLVFKNIFKAYDDCTSALATLDVDVSVELTAIHKEIISIVVKVILDIEAAIKLDLKLALYLTLHTVKKLALLAVIKLKLILCFDAIIKLL
ncbi:hypothetical protein FRC03_011989 [Tulasnella sp. 419]|nr:hypothetical protein FRC03_011989 [Tulasnella sp. 419]